VSLNRPFLRHFFCYDGSGDAFAGSEVIAILYKRYPGPHPYTTDVLTDAQIIFISQQLPSPKATTGRPAYSNQELLPGILRVLRSGCRWRDLNLPGYPDGSTHWRRLRLWRRGLHFRWLWKRILRMLGEQNPQEKEKGAFGDSYVP
jgi:transposase